jgi:non-specific serine/threonine protein kinase/serine/threonine-protein kinase
LEYLLQGFQWIDASAPPVKRHFDRIAEGLLAALNRTPIASFDEKKEDNQYVGPYRLLDRIGIGGMGEVFRAEQRQPIRRIVAVKRIKPGMDSKEVLARFESERQALARMDHPNIARVFDAGKDDLGRPYFVMEYVPGKPITQFADENKLSIEQRLRLFQDVCLAISHAHTKAVIHRDIKSSNVLATISDDRLQVKVIDFGIAKALTADRLTDHSSATQAGFAIGTLESMSPEQAAGSLDIDTRTDVYSLGVLLYEMLCGQKPFDSLELEQAAEDEARRIIREVDPPRPSTKITRTDATGSKIAHERSTRPESLAKTLRTELEWIPMKAMRKERTRRYQSVAELALDVQNYLDNKPLIAGPESLLYRASKGFRRNRAWVAAALGALLLAALGTLGYVSGIRNEQIKTLAALEQVTREKERTDQALLEADTQRRLAQESSQLASKRLDEKRMALDQMLAAFSDSSLKQYPGSQPVRKLFLERGLEQYRTLLTDEAPQGEASLKVIESLRELGQVEKEMGSASQSLDRLQQAVDACRDAVAQAPDATEPQVALGKSLLAMAQMRFEQNRWEDAKPHVDECIAVFDRLHSADPDNITFATYLAAGRIRQASLLPNDQAIRLLPGAIELLRRAQEKQPDDPEVLIHLSRGINNLATTISDLEERNKRYEEAFRLAEEALKKTPSDEMANALSTNANFNQIRTLEELGRHREALVLLQKTISTKRQFCEDNPSLPDSQKSLGRLLQREATLLETLGRIQDAVQSQNQAIEVFQERKQRFPSLPDGILQVVRSQMQLEEIQGRSAATSENAGTYLGWTRELIEGIKKFPNREEYLSEFLTLQLQSLAGLPNQWSPNRRLNELASSLEQMEIAFGENPISDPNTASQYCAFLKRFLLASRDAKLSTPSLSVLQRGLRRCESLEVKDASVAITAHSLRVAMANDLKQNKRYKEAADLRQQLIVNASKLSFTDTGTLFSEDYFAWAQHAPLVECYRKLNDPKLEFESLRNYFRETSKYITASGTDIEAIDQLAYSASALDDLRMRFSAEEPSRNLASFELFDRYDGEKKFIRVEVSDSWERIELQRSFLIDSGRLDISDAPSFQILRDLQEDLRDVPGGLRMACQLIATQSGNVYAGQDQLQAARLSWEKDRSDPTKATAFAKLLLRKIASTENSGSAAAAARKLFQELDEAIEAIRSMPDDDSSGSHRADDFLAESIYHRALITDLPRATHRLQLLEALQRLDKDSPPTLRRRILYALGNTSQRLRESVSFFGQALEAGEKGAVEPICLRITPWNRDLLSFLPEEMRRSIDSIAIQDARVFKSQLRDLLTAFADERSKLSHSEVEEVEPSPTAPSSEESSATAVESNTDSASKQVAEAVKKRWEPQYSRTIVLLYGVMESNEPFWVFAAIRPSRYQEFMQAHKEGKVDLEAFAPWGELIISGEGKTPPKIVLDKVATMYQTDPEQFSKRFEDEEDGKGQTDAAKSSDASKEKGVASPEQETPEDLLAKSPWEEFLQIPDKKLEWLLTRRQKHFSQPGYESDLVRTAEYLNRFEKPIEAAKALMTVVNRLSKKDSTESRSSNPATDAGLDLDKLRQRALDYLRDGVEDPEFYNYSDLASEEAFLPLHDDPEFRRLFLVN